MSRVLMCETFTTDDCALCELQRSAASIVSDLGELEDAEQNNDTGKGRDPVWAPHPSRNRDPSTAKLGLELASLSDTDSYNGSADTDSYDGGADTDSYDGGADSE